MRKTARLFWGLVVGVVVNSWRGGCQSSRVSLVSRSGVDVVGSSSLPLRLTLFVLRSVLAVRVELAVWLWRNAVDDMAADAAGEVIVYVAVQATWAGIVA